MSGSNCAIAAFAGGTLRHERALPSQRPLVGEVMPDLADRTAPVA
jgi:hypothetical protein